MTKDDALELALEALENTTPTGFNMETDKRFYEAITAIKEALSDPEQEPVGKFAKFTDNIWREVTDGSAGVPLYTTPPKCKPLLDEFGYWWFEYGSGLYPLEREDQEEHAYRVANAAWQAAHGIKEKKT